MKRPKPSRKPITSADVLEELPAFRIEVTNEYVTVRRDLLIAVAAGRGGWRLAMLLDWLVRFCGGRDGSLSLSAQGISNCMLGAMPRGAVLDALGTLIAWGLVTRHRSGAAWFYGVNHQAVVERFKKHREHLPPDDPFRSDTGLAGLRSYLNRYDPVVMEGPETIQ